MNFNLYIDGPDTHEDYILPAFSVPIFHYKIFNWKSKKENLLRIYNSRINQKEKFKVSEGKEDSLDIQTDFHFNYDNSDDHYSDQIEKILKDELLFDTLFLYCDLPGKKILGYNFLKFKMVTS